MTIKQFLNPILKKIDNISNKIIEKITKTYSTKDKIDKIDEKDIIIPKISHIRAF